MRMLSSHHLRRTLLALTVASALAAVPLASSAAGKPDGPRARSAVPGEILVGFKATVSASAQDSILAAAGARGRDRFAAIHGALVSVAPGAPLIRSRR
jgi:hypothetical protein